MPARRLSYHEIADDIATRIEAGELKVGDKLPSYTEMQEIYSVSRSTVSRAMLELRALGYVGGHQGLGVFVARRAKSGRT